MSKSASSAAVVYSSMISSWLLWQIHQKEMQKPNHKVLFKRTSVCIQQQKAHFFILSKPLLQVISILQPLITWFRTAGSNYVLSRSITAAPSCHFALFWDQVCHFYVESELRIRTYDAGLRSAVAGTLAGRWMFWTRLTSPCFCSVFNELVSMLCSVRVLAISMMGCCSAVINCLCFVLLSGCYQ